jgi:hypothetical protein
MIPKNAVEQMKKTLWTSAMRLVQANGDDAESIAYLTLSGDDLQQMLQAIKDYRAYKEEGWRIVR